MTDTCKPGAYQEIAEMEIAVGALRGQSGATIDHAQMVRVQRVQSAIWALTEARRVRADPALMAEIRAWVAEKRNEFMLLMDDIGGSAC